MPREQSPFSWVLILLLVVAALTLFSAKTTAIQGQPVSSCSSLVQAAGVSCSIGNGLFRKVSASFPLQSTTPVIYVQDSSSGNLYRLLPNDATTAQRMSEIPDMSQVTVLGLLTIPSAWTDPTYNFTGDLTVQGITIVGSASVITNATTMTVFTSTGSVVTVSQATYTIVATVPGSQTTMVETVTGGTYTLTGTHATIFPSSSPSLACPVGQYRDQNVGTCLPNPVKPVVAAFVKFLNWLRCLFGYC
jgi:hypothetical protein